MFDLYPNDSRFRAVEGGVGLTRPVIGRLNAFPTVQPANNRIRVADPTLDRTRTAIIEV